MKVYLKTKTVFEGTKFQCKNWILDQAVMLTDFTKDIKSWQEKGKYFYTVGGKTYSTDESIFTNYANL